MRIENAKIDQVSVGGDADIVSVVQAAVSCGGGSYICSVSIRIVNAVFSGEVLIVDNTGTEGSVCRINAGVKNGNPDSGSVERVTAGRV